MARDLGLPDDWAELSPLERFAATSHLTPHVTCRAYGLDPRIWSAEVQAQRAGRWDAPSGRRRCEGTQFGPFPCHQLAAPEHGHFCYKHMSPIEWVAVKRLRAARRRVAPLVRVEVPPGPFAPSSVDPCRIAFSMSEVAEVTGLGYERVYWYCRSSWIVAHWLSPRMVRILREDLERFIEEHRERASHQRDEYLERQRTNAEKVDVILRRALGPQ